MEVILSSPLLPHSSSSPSQRSNHAAQTCDPPCTIVTCVSTGGSRVFRACASDDEPSAPSRSHRVVANGDAAASPIALAVASAEDAVVAGNETRLGWAGSTRHRVSTAAHHTGFPVGRGSADADAENPGPRLLPLWLLFCRPCGTAGRLRTELRRRSCSCCGVLSPWLPPWQPFVTTTVEKTMRG